MSLLQSNGPDIVVCTWVPRALPRVSEPVSCSSTTRSSSSKYLLDILWQLRIFSQLTIQWVKMTFRCATLYYRMNSQLTFVCLRCKKHCCCDFYICFETGCGGTTLVAGGATVIAPSATSQTVFDNANAGIVSCWRSCARFMAAVCISPKCCVRTVSA
jgi:hypothetical protein